MEVIKTFLLSNYTSVYLKKKNSKPLFSHPEIFKHTGAVVRSEKSKMFDLHRRAVHNQWGIKIEHPSPPIYGHCDRILTAE